MPSKKWSYPRPRSITREELFKNQCDFLAAIERSIEFHRTNPDDPHNVGTAVVVALTEIRDCYKAYMF